jgi:hypothetical protein
VNAGAPRRGRFLRSKNGDWLRIAACPAGLSLGDKVTWCIKWCNDHKIFRDTCVGPDTERPWGPFHPITPGPVLNWLDVIFGIKFIPAGAADPHCLYCAPSALVGIEEA